MGKWEDLLPYSSKIPGLKPGGHWVRSLMSHWNVNTDAFDRVGKKKIQTQVNIATS